MLVGGIRRIEAVAAVGVDRQARNAADLRVGQHRAIIDIAVVGRHAARDRAVFQTAIRVRNRSRRVVGPGQRDRQRRGRGPAPAV